MRTVYNIASNDCAVKQYGKIWFFFQFLSYMNASKGASRSSSMLKNQGVENYRFKYHKYSKRYLLTGFLVALTVSCLQVFHQIRLKGNVCNYQQIIIYHMWLCTHILTGLSRLACVGLNLKPTGFKPGSVSAKRIFRQISVFPKKATSSH